MKLVKKAGKTKLIISRNEWKKLAQNTYEQFNKELAFKDPNYAMRLLVDSHLFIPLDKWVDPIIQVAKPVWGKILENPKRALRFIDSDMIDFVGRNSNIFRNAYKKTNGYQEMLNKAIDTMIQYPNYANYVIKNKLVDSNVPKYAELLKISKSYETDKNPQLNSRPTDYSREDYDVLQKNIPNTGEAGFSPESTF